MRYISTRGQAPTLNFEDVLLAGLASDGGLYVPENLPRFTVEEIASWAGLPYHELAFKVMRPFVAGSIPDADFKQILEETYGVFAHSAVAPLRQLNGNEWVLELFHGPTLAFKDFALQLLGRLLDYVLAKRGERVVIIGATSGDTGSAAIEGCRRCENVDIFILHPHNRVSEVQRRQMTTILGENIQLRRPGFPQGYPSGGGELDQLGADHGPDRLLLPCGAAVGRPGAFGGFLGADRQLRRYLRRLSGSQHGAADQPAGGGDQSQRHPAPLHERQPL